MGGASPGRPRPHPSPPPTGAPTASRDAACIAWAAGVDDEWWDPATGYVWPSGLPRDVTVDTLVRVYERHGFVACTDAQPEPGFEKIVIYGVSGEWEHAARQLDNGKWTSKMGPDEDIEHDSPKDLAGGAFGLVVRMMKRLTAVPKQPAAAPTSPAVPKTQRARRKRRKR